MAVATFVFQAEPVGMVRHGATPERPTVKSPPTTYASPLCAITTTFPSDLRPAEYFRLLRCVFSFNIVY